MTHTPQQESTQNRMQEDKTELAIIREELKYSMSEMAQELKISKSVYQGYETNRRATPPHTLEMAFAALQRVREFDKRYAPGGELDQIMADVPLFMSDPIKGGCE
jgi:transcriptional regulator with XRE-family HTH domain